MTERTIFLAALEIADPAARAAYLDGACGADPALRRRVEELLAAAGESGSFLERPAAERVEEPTAPCGGPDTLSGTATADGPREPAGTVLADRYVLGPAIGEGGMGTVYRAEQVRPVRRPVAVKLIRPGMDSRTVLLRFEAERQALAVMDHPNIAKVLDAGTTPDGRPFFAMELVNGTPLTDYCDARRLPVAGRLELFRRVCEAVQHAHQKGVIHRDLKPGNILVEEHPGGPVPKVIDFGLAKAVGGTLLTDATLVTAPGGVAGTPLYMAPEQAGPDARDIDTRADVYALGAILYELLTGSTPIQRDTLRRAALHELLRVIREEEPPPPSRRLSSSDALPSVAANRGTEPARLGRVVRGDLDWVVMKALDKDRARRYDSAAAFAADVDRFLHHEPVAAGPPGRWYRARKFVRRNRAAVTAAGLVLATLVAGIAGTTAGLIEARRQRDATDDALIEVSRQRDAADRERNAAVAARQEADKRSRQLERSANLLGGIFTDIDPRYEQTDPRPLRIILRDRFAAAAGALDTEGIADPVVAARLQAALGEALVTLGDPARGAELLGRAADVLKAEPDGGGRAGLQVRADRAVAIRYAGDIPRATRELEEVLRLADQSLPADHPLVLSVRRELGESYYLAGRAKEAVALLEPLVAPTEAHFGAGHLRVLGVVSKLAAAYNVVGRSDAAIALLEPVIAAAEARYKPDHVTVLDLRQILGTAYITSRRAADAVRVLEPAVRALEAGLGANNEQVLNAKMVLANAYSNSGAPDKAVGLLETALPACEARWGEDSLTTLSVRISLGNAYMEVGKPDRAVPVLERGLALIDKMFPPSHPAATAAAIGLSASYRALGQFDKAIPMYDRVRAGFAANYPAEHPEVLLARSNHAEAVRDSGRPDLAVPLHDALLADVRKAYGPGHPVRLYQLRVAVPAYERSRRLDRALELAAEVVAGERKAAPPNAARLASALTQLGSLQVAAGRHPDAEAVLRESLATKLRDEPDDWRTFLTRSLLGAALAGQGKYDAAEPELRTGYEGMSRRKAAIPPPARDRLPESADRLIKLYEAWGKPDELKKWQAERAKYPNVAPPPRLKP